MLTIGNVKEDLYEAAGSDGEEEYDPPVIHMLVLGDTIKDICRKYDISVYNDLKIEGATYHFKPIRRNNRGDTEEAKVCRYPFNVHFQGVYIRG